MPVFSILQSLAVFWHLVSPRLPTCFFAYLLVDYHTFFVLRFSLVFLIRPSCRCVRPIPVYVTTTISLYIDIVVIASIFLYLPKHSCYCFPFKGSKRHFPLLGHNPSFDFPPSTILRTEAAGNFETSINFYWIVSIPTAVFFVFMCGLLRCSLPQCIYS